MIQVTKLKAIYGNKLFYLHVAQTGLGMIYTLDVQDSIHVSFWEEKELDKFIEDLWQAKYGKRDETKDSTKVVGGDFNFSKIQTKPRWN